MRTACLSRGVRVGSDSDDDRRSTPGLSIQSKLKQAGLDSDLEDDEDDDDEDDLEPMDGPAEVPHPEAAVTSNDNACTVYTAHC